MEATDNQIIKCMAKLSVSDNPPDNPPDRRPVYIYEGTLISVGVRVIFIAITDRFKPLRNGLYTITPDELDLVDELDMPEDVTLWHSIYTRSAQPVKYDQPLNHLNTVIKKVQGLMIGSGKLDYCVRRAVAEMFGLSRVESAFVYKFYTFVVVSMGTEMLLIKNNA